MKQTIILLAGILVLGLSALVTVSATIEKSTSYGAFFVQEQDPNLEIEDWMINKDYWSENSNELTTIAVESETELEIEPWMVEESIWN